MESHKVLEGAISMRVASRRYFHAVGYILFLALAVGCYYFTISDTLFTWFYPDELILSQTYNNLGLFGCIHNYYLHTTVNRLSADIVGCLMAKGAVLFSTPYQTWVFARLAIYILIPVSLGFLIREISKIPFKFSVIIALLIATAGLFVMLNYGFYIYGLDLAIYGLAAASFFTLAALFIKSIENSKYLLWFCLVYPINLTSHEIFLVISGFFIPLYAWYRHPHHGIAIGKWIKTALADRRIWILSAIYLVSALTSLLAPGIAIREKVWPTTGSLLDGVMLMTVTMEEVVYSMVRMHIVMIFVFSLGVIFRLFSAEKYSAGRHTLLYGLLLSAPIIYFLVLGFLVGITPTIWGGHLRTEGFRWLEPFLSHFLANKKILDQGGFYPSRVLFLYIAMFFDVFLVGFLITGFCKKWVNRLGIVIGKRLGPVISSTALFLVMAFVCFLHPDGVGSMRTVSAFFQKQVDLDHYSPQQSKKLYPERSLFQVAFASTATGQAVSRVLFPRHRSGNNPHEVNVTNIMVDRYFKMHRGEKVPPRILDLLYDYQVAPNSLAVRQTRWKNLMYKLYQVFPQG